MGPKFDLESRQGVRSSQSGKTSGEVPKAGSAAQELGEKAKQGASEIVETQFSNQKEKATGGMVHVAEALRKSGEHLRGQQQDQIASFAEKAADQVERISSYIKSSNLKQLVNELEGLARREPALFLGGAFTVGLLGARFLKSSARRESSGSSRSTEMRSSTFTRSSSPAIGRYGTQAGQLGSLPTITPGESPSASRPANWPADGGEH